MHIGILDIQGSVEEHFEAISGLDNVESVLVKNREGLRNVDALILPGGESTTIGKLMRRFGLHEAICKRVRDGMPVLGTCAGAILLAKKVSGEGAKKVDGLKLMNIEVERNGYGRQLDSFEGEIVLNGKKMHGVFIRAPRIVKMGKNVEVLGECNGEIVAVKEGNMVATTFHPEMGEAKNMIRLFL